MYGRFEEQDTSDMNPQQAAWMIKKLYPDIIVGIKSAHYWGDFTQVDKAVQAGNLANVPVIVDFVSMTAEFHRSIVHAAFEAGDIFYAYLFVWPKSAGNRC